MGNRIAIIGAGGHASVLADLSKLISDVPYVVINDEEGLVKIDNSYVNRTSYKNEYEFIIGIGDNLVRQRFQKELLKEGFNITTLVHPSAVIASSVEIKQGSCVIAGAIINNDVLIGEGCIINTKVSIDHHSSIGNYTHVAPGATIAGQCNIGKRCLIGVGASLKNGVTIVDDVIIGAGGVVIEDILEPGTYVGVPVKKVK